MRNTDRLIIAHRYLLLALLVITTACARQANTPKNENYLHSLCSHIFVAESFSTKKINEESPNNSYTLSFTDVSAQCNSANQEKTSIEISFKLLSKPSLKKQYRSRSLAIPIFIVATLDEKTIAWQKNKHLLVKFTAAGTAHAKWKVSLTHSKHNKNLSLYLGFAGAEKTSLHELLNVNN